MGAIELRFAQPRAFSEEEQTFILAVIGQGALAFDRARLAQQMHHTNHKRNEMRVSCSQNAKTKARLQKGKYSRNKIPNKE
jgi:hypothetical protein